MAIQMRPRFEPIPALKASTNVGALFDIPTGKYYLGRHGESLLNAGVGLVTGVVGKANRFKSTVMNYLIIRILANFNESLANSYDTEMNIQEQEMMRLIVRQGLNPDDFFNPNGLDRWLITDKTRYWGDQWFALLKEFFEDKEKNLKHWMRESPFLDRDGKSLIMLPVPTISAVDSLSEMMTSDVAKMVDENDLGEKGGNTIYMRQGLSKKRFLTEIPVWAARLNNPIFLTSHIGKMSTMDTNPNSMPEKRLQYMNAGDDLKGVTGSFSYLTTFCIHCVEATALQDKDTRASLYPRSSDDSMVRDTDLNEVNITYLRNKFGRSGLTAKLLISQVEGLLPSLTEFYYSKTNDKDYKFAFTGHDKAYQSCFLPKVNLQRTTVRTKLDTNERLRRAILIGSEMTQMRWLWQGQDAKYRITPQQLYHDLVSAGYKMEELLDTRSQWTFDNDTAGMPYLSTMDLLRMRTKEYHPFWMKSKPDDGFVSLDGLTIASTSAEEAPELAPA
jgi:hypothetical protein